MTIEEALNILKLNSNYTEEDLKRAYHTQILINHPDVKKTEEAIENSKLINVARDLLKKNINNKTEVIVNLDLYKKTINRIKKDYLDIDTIIKNIDKEIMFYNIIIKHSSKFYYEIIQLLETLSKNNNDKKINKLFIKYDNIKHDLINNLLIDILKELKRNNVKNYYKIFYNIIEKEYYKEFSYYLNDQYTDLIELVENILNKYNSILNIAEIKYNLSIIINKKCKDKSYEEKNIIFNKVYKEINGEHNNIDKAKIRKLVKKTL